MSQGQAYKNKVKPETIVWLEENFPSFFTFTDDITELLNDIADLASDISELKEQIDKLAGLAPEAGADLVSIGTAGTRYKLHSLLVNIGALTPGATITVKLFMAVAGTERKVYEQAFTQGTDPDGLWIVNGTLAIHEVLRVEVESDNAGDNGLAIDYDYMLEAM
jgi:hypothetical protein